MAKATFGSNNVAGKVSLGLTTVAITAGAVALGTVLASKRNRTALQKQAKKAVKGIKQVRKVIDDGRERAQVFAHRIAAVGKKIKKSSDRVATRGKRVRRLISA